LRPDPRRPRNGSPSGPRNDRGRIRLRDRDEADFESPLTCAEFEELWNEVLDLPTWAGSADLESALDQHAWACEHCREVGERYENLRMAIAAWVAPPEPSAELSEALLRLPPPAPTVHSPARSWGRLVAVAALILAGVGTWAVVGTSGDSERFPVPKASPSRPGPRLETLRLASAAVAPLKSQPSRAGSLTPSTTDLDPRRLKDVVRASMGMLEELSAPFDRLASGVFHPTDVPAGKAWAEITVDEDSTEEEATSSGVLQSFQQRVASGLGPISNLADGALRSLRGTFAPPNSTAELGDFDGS
jgi:hypothetical protein